MKKEAESKGQISIPLFHKGPAFGIGWVAVEKWNGQQYKHLTSFRSEEEADEFISASVLALELEGKADQERERAK